MINSLCPLPIGTIPSIDLIPVCSGSDTGFLEMIPDAFLSISMYFSDLISPFPSIGSPRALTTLPNIASPAGTETTLPVALTSSPSLIKEKSPRITAPTLSSSRFSAIPITPCGNSRSSPDIALLSP